MGVAKAMRADPPIDGECCTVIRFSTTPMDAASTREDDPVHDAIERLTWDVNVAGIDAHDYHKTASTLRSRTAAFLAWQGAFLLDQHGEARP